MPAKVAAQMLELTGDERAFLARSSLFALLTMPVLPVVKFLRTIAHFVNHQPDVVRKHWTALPALLIGLYTWGSGFVTGARDDPLRFRERGAIPPGHGTKYIIAFLCHSNQPDTRV